MRQSQPLKRILGTPTAWLIGMGIAIGSGIFRTPGQVADHLPTVWLIVAAWLVGGGIVLMQGIVTAELATRYPKAGGEYVYLREAYGEFVAFFFGWAYTVFIIGGGAATIALAFGDFTCDLFAFDPSHSGYAAAAALIVVTAINAVGLRAGAGAQNILTVLKVLALLGVVIIGFGWGGGEHSPPAEASGTISRPLLACFLGALLPVLWSYAGTTDPSKLAEEIKDVRRALPRAIIGSTLSLAAVYTLFNVALLRIVPLNEMAQYPSVPGEAMSRLFGDTGRNVMLVVAMLVCLSALSATVLATIRVTFALARDGLTFGFMARMSRGQSPVAALLVVGGFATVLVMLRDFEHVLGIYFFAAAILFGLAYASLIVFRYRERAFPPNVYRCPMGPVMAGIVIVIQCAMAVYIARTQPKDVFYTTLMLALFGLLYLVWKRAARSA